MRKTLSGTLVTLVALVLCAGCSRKDDSSQAAGAKEGGGAPSVIPGVGRPSTPRASDEDSDATSDSKLTPEQIRQLTKIAPDFAKAAKKLQDLQQAPKVASPVDFRKLRDLLPESLSGLKRQSPTGRKTGDLGVAISYAEADYEGEIAADGTVKNIKIKITDLGGMSSNPAMAAGWVLAEVDDESEEGYRKTFTQGSYKGFEEYDKQEQATEVKLLVADRFMVELSGDAVPVADVKAALGKIDLKKLEALKSEGPAAPGQQATDE
jgi:hypothetical protein